MEITKELFDKKAVEALHELTDKSIIYGICGSMAFSMLKHKLFDEEIESNAEDEDEDDMALNAPETHDFPFAIMNVLRHGKKAKRLGWNGKDQYIERGEARYREMGGREYLSGGEAIVFHGTSGVQVGWLASQGDMLADDWVVFD